MAGDDIETDFGFGDQNGKTNTHKVSFEYFRASVTHPVMTPDVRIVYKLGLKNSPFVKPCYIEQLDGLNDYVGILPRKSRT